MSDLILVLLIVVSLILFVVTVILIVSGTRKRRNYDECTGIIEGFHEYKTPMHKAGERSFSPVISYTVHGRKYEFVGDYGSTSMKVGQKIHILYDRTEPSKATVKQGLFVAPMITGVLTLVFTLALVIFAILKSSGVINF